VGGHRAGLLLAFAGLGATASVIPASLPALAQVLEVGTAQLAVAVPALFTGLFLGVALSPAVTRRRGPGPAAFGAGVQSLSLALLAGAPNTAIAVLAATAAGIGFGLTEAGGAALAKVASRDGASRSLLPLTAATATAAAATPLLLLAGGTAAVRPTLVAVAVVHLLAAAVLALTAGTARTTRASLPPAPQPGRAPGPPWLAAALFCYVGGETVLAGWSAVIPREVLALSPTTSAAGTSLFWVMLLAGRVVGTAALARGSLPHTVLVLCQVGAALTLAGSAATAGTHPVATVVLLCTAAGLMGPCYALLLGIGLETVPAAAVPRRSATLITVGALGGATWTFLVTTTGQAPAWLAGSAAAAMTISAAAAARHRAPTPRPAEPRPQ
jgi:fucose permease